MPSARSLLNLYPRSWRERYGDEFLDTCGERLSFQQTIDIVAGAIDARFAPQSHLAANAGRQAQGVTMTVDVKSICARPKQPLTTADGMKGAAVMIAGTIMFLAVGIVCNRLGWHDAGEFFKALSFPVSSLMSSYVMFMRSMSTIAKVVIFGGTLTLLILISALATRI